jgi:hypothetical protein
MTGRTGGRAATEDSPGEAAPETTAGVRGCQRDEAPIWLARGQKVPVREAWPRLEHYE